VQSIDEVNQVLSETLAADPKGEVILMPFLDQAYSSVLTDSAVTMGLGTNGATSGQSAITIPCHSDNRRLFKGFSDIIEGQKSLAPLTYARVTPRSGIFIETVGPYCVQLRTGPKTNFATTRWSTQKEICVNVVYTVHGSEDFLEFENRLAEYLKCHTPSQIVVHLPNGALSSHYAIQAITKGVSVIAEPGPVEVNSVQTFKTSQPALPFTQTTIDSIRQGMQAGLGITPNAGSINWAIAIIQGLGPSTKNQESIKLILAAGTIIMRAGLACCFGEYRHFRVHVKNGGISLGPLVQGSVLGPAYTRYTDRPSREYVFMQVFDFDWSKIDVWYRTIGLISGTAKDFHSYQWSTGFGGSRWGECSDATQAILEALLPCQLIATGSYAASSEMSEWALDRLNQIVQTCNRLITLSHNSARCLTKFVTQSQMTKITQGATGYTIATSPLTMKVLTHESTK